MGSSVSANERIQPRTVPPGSPVMVSIRLRTPRCASRWLIGTLACPSGLATSVRYSRYPGRTHSRHCGTMSSANLVVCS